MKSGLKSGLVAFCFPGQGSLEVGMGREIVAAVPEALDVFERAANVASNLQGEPSTAEREL